MDLTVVVSILAVLLLSTVFSLVWVVHVLSARDKPGEVALLVEANIAAQEGFMERQQDMNNAILVAMKNAHEFGRELESKVSAQGYIRETGLLPFLENPGERILHEVDTVMQQLGVDRAGAIEYIRRGLASVPGPEE